MARVATELHLSITALSYTRSFCFLILTATKIIGPFSDAIRPFTINGKQTLCFVNVNALLGFEVGDLQTGKVLHHVAVEGFKTGKSEAPRLPEPRHRL